MHDWADENKKTMKALGPIMVSPTYLELFRDVMPEAAQEQETKVEKTTFEDNDVSGDTSLLLDSKSDLESSDEDNSSEASEASGKPKKEEKKEEKKENKEMPKGKGVQRQPKANKVEMSMSESEGDASEASDASDSEDEDEASDEGSEADSESGEEDANR